MAWIFPLVWLALVVCMFIGMYKTFSKMGYDDAWMAIIPLLNLIFFVKFLDKPIWWVILFFIPLVNIYAAWLVSEKVAKAYNKGTGFAVGLLLLAGIFYMILGFGSDTPAKTA